jgi:hypothetical protein
MKKTKAELTGPKFIRPSDAERIFGIHRSQIYNAGRPDYSGCLPRPFRVDGCLLVDAHALEKALNEAAKAGR